MLAKNLQTHFIVFQSKNTKHFSSERIQQVPVDLGILGHSVSITVTGDVVAQMLHISHTGWQTATQLFM